MVAVPLKVITLVNLACQVGIVVTGGAVRLTDSGLGCPTVPNCTDESFFPTPELAAHGVIEFGNRMLGYVVGLVAVLTFLALWRARRRDLYGPAAAIAVGVAFQGGLGAVTVTTGLNPWTVMGHFLVSMGLIAAATVLFLRSRIGPIAPPEAPVARAGAPRPVRALIRALAGLLALVLVLGTLTTGSGPHSGDPAAGRMGLDLALISRLHGDSVYLLVALTVVLLVVTHRGPAEIFRAARWVLAAELLQATIGIVQYNANLPVLLVGAHMLGAALLVVAIAGLWFLALSPLQGASRPSELARLDPGLGNRL